jgi:hypothetical protein
MHIQWRLSSLRLFFSFDCITWHSRGCGALIAARGFFSIFSSSSSSSSPSTTRRLPGSLGAAVSSVACFYSSSNASLLHFLLTRLELLMLYSVYSVVTVLSLSSSDSVISLHIHANEPTQRRRQESLASLRVRTIPLFLCLSLLSSLSYSCISRYYRGCFCCLPCLPPSRHVARRWNRSVITTHTSFILPLRSPPPIVDHQMSIRWIVQCASLPLSN